MQGGSGFLVDIILPGKAGGVVGRHVLRCITSFVACAQRIIVDFEIVLWTVPGRRLAARRY